MTTKAPAGEIARSGAVHRPLFGEVGVLGLVPDVWGAGPNMSRHQVMTRLSRYFHVVWVDPPSEWREVWLSGSRGKTPVDVDASDWPGFSIYRPGKWLPRFYRPPSLARWTARERLRQARSFLQRRGCSTTILYLWRDEFDYALDAIAHDISCYHIVDEYTFSPIECEIRRRERRVIELVDQVIIHSRALMDKKGHLNPHTVRIPNGVDYEAYAARYEEPEDLKGIPHPRLGYVGVIKKHLNLYLLADLAQRRPDCSFVLVGPTLTPGKQEAAIASLSSMKNVHFLGPRPVDSLPAYMGHMDVALMCYEVDGYTKYTYPLKLHQYLAAGLPIIGTPIDSLLEFTSVVRLAQTVEEWSGAIDEVLDSASLAHAEVDRRRRVARQFDWNRLVAEIACALCQRLGGSYPEVLANALPGSECIAGEEGATEIPENRPWSLIS